VLTLAISIREDVFFAFNDIPVTLTPSKFTVSCEFAKRAVSKNIVQKILRMML
jgi:hypothetical protein